MIPVHGPGMHLGLVVETNDPERLPAGERRPRRGPRRRGLPVGRRRGSPDLDHEKFYPHGVVRKYQNEGGELYACGTCLDSRNLDEDDLRPRSTMADCLAVVEAADEVLTVG